MQLVKYSFTLILLAISCTAVGQLGDTYDIERPEKYENRKIGYEKTYTKKFGLPRRFIQNTISHYNFFFNANEKIKQVILAAKEANKDTFDRLLTYYPYSLETTKGQKQDLDSVIDKASGGILLHDLRSNWVDNFYLLIGKSYLLQQKYDSAEMTFNYINYEYAPKTKDKEHILTGSKENDEGNSFSIATKEKNSFVKKVFERPPSRNEAFLWMIRTHIENGDYGSAAGLVQTLQNDPIFPKRLHNDLDELTGYLFYKQEAYDSAAHYLVKSLSIADNKNDRARREFLAAQLYELGNKPATASDLYAQSVKHTLDPVMEVYARLYSIRLRKSNDPKIVDENIAALTKMGKKDAYQDYADIIYYFAGKMEQERNNNLGAINNYIKSVAKATNNISQKNKSLLALADIAYSDKKYRFASNYYDSLNLADGSLKDVDAINAKRLMLKNLVTYIDIIETEDSLQRIAILPANERDAYLKQLLRRLRKEQGLKEDASTGTAATVNINNNNTPNLFEPGSGDWYFYNNTIKNRGNVEFKQRWGSRPNVDNWRRIQAMDNIATAGANRGQTSLAAAAANNTKKQPSALTLESLESNLPIAAMQLKASNDTIELAMLNLAKVYQFELEDVPMAIETYEALLKRFPSHTKMEEVLYNMYLAYSKNGNTQKAAQAKAALQKNFGGGKYSNATNAKADAKTDVVTKEYTTVYNLFIEGKFAEAIALKKKVDSMYLGNNWTPQLLYIEAIYYTKERKDSLAINSLDYILRQFPTSPLALKANNLKNVISRRTVIEHELEQLKVTRNLDVPIVIDNTPTVVTTPTPPKPVPTTPPTTNPVVTKPKDTVAVVKPLPQPTAPPKYPYKQADDKEHYVAVVLNKVDNIFTNEARNAFVIYNRGTGRTLRVDNTPLDADNKMLLMQTFANATDAISYITTAQAKAATDIVPWLAKEKYSFIILTEENLLLLQKDKNVENYKNYLKATYPGKF